MIAPSSIASRSSSPFACIFKDPTRQRLFQVEIYSLHTKRGLDIFHHSLRSFCAVQDALANNTTFKKLREALWSQEESCSDDEVDAELEAISSKDRLTMLTIAATFPRKSWEKLQNMKKQAKTCETSLSSNSATHVLFYTSLDDAYESEEIAFPKLSLKADPQNLSSIFAAISENQPDGFFALKLRTGPILPMCEILHAFTKHARHTPIDPEIVPQVMRRYFKSDRCNRETPLQEEKEQQPTGQKEKSQHHAHPEITFSPQTVANLTWSTRYLLDMPPNRGGSSSFSQVSFSLKNEAYETSFFFSLYDTSSKEGARIFRKALQIFCSTQEALGRNSTMQQFYKVMNDKGDDKCASDVWETLPENDRDTLIDVCPRFEKGVWEQYVSMDKVAKEMLEGNYSSPTTHIFFYHRHKVVFPENFVVLDPHDFSSILKNIAQIPFSGFILLQIQDQDRKPPICRIQHVFTNHLLPDHRTGIPRYVPPLDLEVFFSAMEIYFGYEAPQKKSSSRILSSKKEVAPKEDFKEKRQQSGGHILQKARSPKIVFSQNTLGEWPTQKRNPPSFVEEKEACI
ncbi:MAG: hypothetical protein AAGF04_01315 [Chlamydiota bacterium]